MGLSIRTMTIVAILAGWASVAMAGECGCQDGCCRGGGKVCKLVKTEKEVTVTCYGCKCKDMCIPKPACDGCTVTEHVDCKAGKCNENGADCKVTYSTDVPGCGRVRNISQLVKYEVKKKVPAYKWEIVDCGCCECAKNSGAKVADTAAPDVLDATGQDPTQVPGPSRVARRSLIPTP